MDADGIDDLAILRANRRVNRAVGRRDDIEVVGLVAVRDERDLGLAVQLLGLVRIDNGPGHVTTNKRRAIARLLKNIGCVGADEPYQAFRGTCAGHLAFI